MGRRSIRIDMAPLFRPASSSARTVLRDQDQDQDSGLAEAASGRADESKSMAELLDEISRIPTSSADKPRTDHAIDDYPSFPQNRVAATRPTTRSQALTVVNDNSGELDFDNLHLANRTPVHYDQDMDWSPTQSKHRAFNTYGQRATQGFNEAPTEPPKGFFWYHVPPAPTTPAQRVFNPPNQPRLRKSPITQPQSQNISFGATLGRAKAERDDRPTVAVAVREEDEDESNSRRRQGGFGGVAFAEPKFFPPQRESDPRNTLSDMFGQGLTLSQREEEERERRRRESAATGAGAASWWRGFLPGTSAANSAKRD